MTDVGYHIRNGWLQKPPLGVQLNWAHPLTKGLVGCWLFNEGGGDKVYDLSGYNNHGTLTDMAAPPTTTSGWNPCKDGVGLMFNGSSNYVTCGNDSSLDLTDAITIEARINFKGPSAQSNHMIVGRGASWRFGCASPALNRFGFYAPAPYTGGWTPYITVQRNVWQHIVFTYDESLPSNNAKMYKEGILEEQEDASGSFSQGDIYIGAYAAYQYYFNGSIDWVRIRNRALSAFEIGWLHREPYAMFEPATKYTIIDERLATDYVGGNVMAAELI